MSGFHFLVLQFEKYPQASLPSSLPPYLPPSLPFPSLLPSLPLPSSFLSSLLPFLTQKSHEAQANLEFAKKLGMTLDF